MLGREAWCVVESARPGSATFLLGVRWFKRRGISWNFSFVVELLPLILVMAGCGPRVVNTSWWREPLSVAIIRTRTIRSSLDERARAPWGSWVVLWSWLDQYRLANLASSVMFTNSLCPFEVIVADVPNSPIGGVATLLLKGLGSFSFSIIVGALCRVLNLGSQWDVILWVLLIEVVVDEGTLSIESLKNTNNTTDTRLDSLNLRVLMENLWFKENSHTTQTYVSSSTSCD